MEENYTLQKHWWFFTVPVLVSLLLMVTVIFPIIIMLWAILRYKMDRIEFKDNCFYSKVGIINIDKKSIPLDKISMVSEKTNIFGNMLGFGTLVIESSANNSTVCYSCIKDIDKFVEFMNKKLQNK